MITFNAPQDPWGLRGALANLGASIGQGYEGQKKQQEEALQKQQQGQYLGEALSAAFDMSKPPQERLGGLQEYMSQTGDTSVLPIFKQIGEQISADYIFNREGSPAQEPTEKVTETGEVSSPKGIERFTDSALVALAGNPNRQISEPAKAEMERRKKAQKESLEERKFEQSKFEKERDYHFKQAQPILQQMEKRRGALKEQELALKWMGQGMLAQDPGWFSLDQFANRFGLTEFISPGGILQKAAAKTKLIGTIERLSGRPNQFIEQTTLSAVADLGKTREANEILYIGALTDYNLEKLELQMQDQIRAEDEAEFGYVKGDFAARAAKRMEPVAQDMQTSMAIKMREVIEQDKGDRWLAKQTTQKVPEGTILTPRMKDAFLNKYNGDPVAAITNAKKLGYTILSPARYEELQNANF